MELSPARQKLLFAVIVVVLAVLGYSLVVPALRHTHAPAAAASTLSPAAPPTGAVSSAAQAAPPQSAQAVNIYNWLPFTQADLAAAAQVTTRFGAAYDTFSYTDSADAYLSRMNGLITAELAATLRNGFTTAGVTNLRDSQQQVSSGTAAIVGLRAFGQNSLTFVVSLTQRLQTSQGTSSTASRFAVTVTGSGTAWQVNDIEPATAGNL